MKHRDGQFGEERRTRILQILIKNQEPVKAVYLAQMTGVSRQVIVQDIALLKAKGEPIMATPQGYVYLAQSEGAGIKKVIFCQHAPEDTEKELNILVDHGITVLDVGVEHSVYGKISRPLGLSTRIDVKKFINQMYETRSNLLASLTGGLHFHTLKAPDEESFQEASRTLAAEGLLVKQ